MYNHHDFRDQDFYCSFTHLPNTRVSVNLDELPFTIHNPKSIARLRPAMHLSHQTHRRIPSGLRPDSIDSTASSSSYGSFLSASTSSLRKRKLLSKMKQLFRASRDSGQQQQQNSNLLMRAVSRKPSTLDFRCIGTNDRSQQSSLDISGFVYDAPKIQWHEPRVADGWGEGWFDRVTSV